MEELEVGVVRAGCRKWKSLKVESLNTAEAESVKEGGTGRLSCWLRATEIELELEERLRALVACETSCTYRRRRNVQSTTSVSATVRGNESRS